MNWSDIVLWNSLSYGRAYRVKRWQLSAMLVILAVLIPFVFPVWAVPFITRYLPAQVVIRLA